MQTKSFVLIKKNRVYFEAQTGDNGFKVKVKITPESENLPLNTKLELLVDDISIVSKYGTDFIFQVVSEVKKDDKKILIKSLYNTLCIERCRELGGKWDSEEKIWVFSSIVENEVEELEYLFCSEIATVEIKAKYSNCVDKAPLSFCGYPLAKAWGRDSGATLCENVYLITGRIYSCGSVKNWATGCAEGSVFKLDVSKKLIEKNMDELQKKWEIKFI